MSIKSKAKRDANRKKSNGGNGVSSRSNSAPDDASAEVKAEVEAHADLRDVDGSLLGGIVRRDDEWLLGMDGKMVGNSGSAATMLALIRRAAVMHERTGKQATLNFSDALRDAAHEEARLLGMSFEQFETNLEQNMQANTPDPSNPSPDRSGGALH